MDANNKSKYSHHWKPTTNPTHNTGSKPHQTFNLRYDPQRYSSNTRLQSSANNNISETTKPLLTTRADFTNKYSVDLNRLLHDAKQNKKSASSTIPVSSTTAATTTHSTSNPTRQSSLLPNNTHHNITTRYKSTHSRPPPPLTSSVPLSHNHRTQHNTHSISNNNNNNKPMMDYRTKHTTHNHKTTHNDIKEDNLDDNTSITDKLKSFKLTTTNNHNNNNTNNNNPNSNHQNKFMLSSKSNNILLNTRDNKPHIPIATRSTETQNNLSLIRPNDRVVLYSPVAHCYVCLSDFEDDSMDTMYEKEDLDSHGMDGADGKEFENENALYLQCDDMEGVALLIGETQFCGTCKFLADCKIQLITGQGLYRDKERIIIHSKHTTKFMLQKYDHLGDTGSMSIGDRILIFVEASRCNRKLFWSYCEETQSIILKECENKPSPNEIFVLQKYGQPLEWRRREEDAPRGGDMILDKFFCGARGGDNISVQEFYLCHDILRILSRDSFNGDFIYFIRDAVYGFPRIVFNGAHYGISPLLQSAVDGLLACIEDTAKVRHFVSIHCRAEYGVVSQAFCFEIESHLRDFNILLVQLETRLNRNELTLQNLRFYLQRACRTMNALRRICCDIHLNREKKMNKTEKLYVGSRGGALLNMIQKHINISGERHVILLYQKLLKSAQKPYFNMLSSWIYRGVITDIYCEFMIKEKRHLKKEDLCCEYNNEYWTGRYSLNCVQIPFILADYCDIIVTTGKYLNVMRESRFSFCNDEKREMSKLDECSASQLGECIADQYNFASKALLGMLMNGERIMLRFASISKYMLLECGDWFCYFLDMAQSILLCAAADIKKTKLDRLLELSFRTSNSSRNDPFKDDVCCDIKNSDLNRMVMMLHSYRDRDGDENPNHPNPNQNELMRLSGIEAFALSYKVQWPASIVFTGRNLMRYQLIFRFLFKLKFVSRQLSAAWKLQMSFRELNLHNTHNECLMLRHEMLSFMDSLLFYISYQVIEPNWNRFIHSTQNTIKTVDSLLSAQEAFLTHTLQECLLTHKESIQLLFAILRTAQQYSNFIKRYTNDYNQILISSNSSEKSKRKERKTAIQMCAKDCRSNLSAANFTNSIQKYKNDFHQSVTAFLHNLQKINTIQNNQKVNVLLSKLDYNAYYMPKLISL